MKRTLIYTLIWSISWASAWAISLPVAEDTSTTSRQILTAANGKAVLLALNTNQAALVKFDMASLPAAFSATNIISARLKLYVVAARKPGALSVHTATSYWTEAVITNTRCPSFNTTPIGSVPAAQVVTRRFVVVDVTSAVIAALNGSGPDFGFVLRDGGGQTYIASKEGPGLGPAAELEVDANLAMNAMGGGSFPGSLVLGGNLDVYGLTRQGSEAGTSQPAGGGIITRRVESTNSSRGMVVARTDTMTLERDGTLGGWRIVVCPNAGNVTAVASAQDSNGSDFISQSLVYGPYGYATTNVLFADFQGVISFHCRFGNAYGVGHFTEVSLLRSPNDGSTNWVGTLTSSFNQ